MYRRDFVRRVAEVLREGGVRKIVPFPKHVLHVSDDEGNSKDFSVKKTDRKVVYSIEDVDRVLSACLKVAEDLLKDGDNVSISGFGTLCLKYYKARKSQDPFGMPIELDAQFIPKFVPGKSLKMCAKVYSMNTLKKPIDDDKDIDEDEDIPEWAKHDGT